MSPDNRMDVLAKRLLLLDGNTRISILGELGIETPDYSNPMWGAKLINQCWASSENIVFKKKLWDLVNKSLSEIMSLKKRPLSDRHQENPFNKEYEAEKRMLAHVEDKSERIN